MNYNTGYGRTYNKEENLRFREVRTKRNIETDEASEEKETASEASTTRGS